MIVAAGGDEFDTIACVIGDACDETCSRDALDNSCINDEWSSGRKEIPLVDFAVRNLSAE